MEEEGVKRVRIVTMCYDRSQGRWTLGHTLVGDSQVEKGREPLDLAR